MQPLPASSAPIAGRSLPTRRPARRWGAPNGPPRLLSGHGRPGGKGAARVARARLGTVPADADLRPAGPDCRCAVRRPVPTRRVGRVVRSARAARPPGGLRGRTARSAAGRRTRQRRPSGRAAPPPLRPPPPGSDGASGSSRARTSTRAPGAPGQQGGALEAGLVAHPALGDADHLAAGHGDLPGAEAGEADAVRPGSAQHPTLVDLGREARGRPAPTPRSPPPTRSPGRRRRPTGGRPGERAGRTRPAPRAGAARLRRHCAAAPRPPGPGGGRRVDVLRRLPAPQHQGGLLDAEQPGQAARGGGQGPAVVLAGRSPGPLHRPGAAGRRRPRRSAAPRRITGAARRSRG